MQLQLPLGISVLAQLFQSSEQTQMTGGTLLIKKYICSKYTNICRDAPKGQIIYNVNRIRTWSKGLFILERLNT
jgi:hypothetical protein